MVTIYSKIIILLLIKVESKFLMYVVNEYHLYIQFEQEFTAMRWIFEVIALFPAKAV